MTITAIKAQAKNPERVSVYVDGVYAFSFNHAQLLDQRLRVGLVVDEPRLVELKAASDFGKAYERALLYVMIRPRSVLEVRQYGMRKKWSAEDTQAVIEKLTAKGYIDDGAFARSWIQNRLLHKNTSQRKLRLELKQKGVVDTLIEAALATSEHNDTAALLQLVAKKKRLSRYKDPQKLMRYLVGQGFSYDDIKTALEASADETM